VDLLLVITDASRYLESHDEGVYRLKWEGLIAAENSLNKTPDCAVRLLAYDAVKDMRTVILKGLEEDDDDGGRPNR
jgi:hypothetical protein